MREPGMPIETTRYKAGQGQTQSDRGRARSVHEIGAERAKMALDKNATFVRAAEEEAGRVMTIDEGLLIAMLDE